MRQANHISSFFLRTILATAMATTISLQSIAQEAEITSRFDVSRDGRVTVSDVMLVVNYLMGNVADDEPQLTLSATDVTMTMGKTEDITISGGSANYLTASSNSAVAYPVVSGNTLVIYPVSIGYTDITIRDAKGVRDYKVKVKVTGTAPETVELVDLGLPSGLKWASHNVGASVPEGYGAYYAWGEIAEKDTYDWASYSHCDGTMSTVKNIGENISGTQYDAALMNWGGSWRMPTREEVQELLDNCTWRWTTVNDITGQEATGPNGETLFFPTAGYKAGSRTYSYGSFGNYWTASHMGNSNGGGYSLGSGNAYYMNVSNTKAYIDSYYQNEGYSIRAVSD